MFDNAFDEWKSLCTDEAENVWKKERKELRRAAMLFFVLRQEFNTIEYELSCEMTKFKQKFKLIDDFKGFEKPSESSDLVNVEPLQASKVIHNEEHLNRSPKINKYRKTRPKKDVTSPSLLDIQKENKNQMTSLTSKSNVQLKDGDLVVCLTGNTSAPVSGTQIKNPLANNKQEFNTLEEKQKASDNENIIDSSIIVDDSSDDMSITTKLKRSKPAKSKYLLGKTPTKTKPKCKTLTQMFRNIPTQDCEHNIKTSMAMVDCSKNSKPTDHCDDVTFFELVEDSETTILTDESNKNVQSKAKKPRIANFEDYDNVPVAKDAGPQHAHKTETVRRKADRMKLPGWSCTDCQQYYESLNLPLEELREKMNTCSRHRNKFQPLDETPKGYWDITMASTPENSGDDSTIYF